MNELYPGVKGNRARTFTPSHLHGEQRGYQRSEVESCKMKTVRALEQEVPMVHYQ